MRQTALEVGLLGLFLVSGTPSPGGDDAAANLGADAVLATHPSGDLLMRLRSSAERFGTTAMTVASYDDYARAARANSGSANLLQTVLVSWDETPLNRRDALVLTNPTPQRYGAWPRWAISGARESLPPDRRLVFVGSWNDWAHGAHLEPDVANGHAFLASTRQSLVPPVSAADEQPVG